MPQIFVSVADLERIHVVLGRPCVAGHDLHYRGGAAVPVQTGHASEVDAASRRCSLGGRSLRSEIRVCPNVGGAKRKQIFVSVEDLEQIRDQTVPTMPAAKYRFAGNITFRRRRLPSM